ncbi:site-2 protease family protein [Microcoleus sp. FACHB-831]|uniref:site-2 protease family protein n=1 Tax=Microcoleus sp. FACHB-831 TaxID=2692827 RepID=UPI001683AFD0|nr:site-2 protease family protein [Microcoleus sp. FACHB-831]MBD1920540.1 site-2 protease family protein [Microcoleus sp. FACHB-831]
MQAGWRIGSLFGIPLFINPSWFFILTFVTLANAWDFYPDWGLIAAGSAGLAIALLMFGSLLLHELGHSLAARSQGIGVNSITLFLFGGIASIEQESKTPGEAFKVAVAGPAVSIALWSLFYLLATVIPASTPARAIVLQLGTINLVVALFNLIPGLPLDGGQILKAAVWKLTGNRYDGVRWAAKTGQILGGGAIALGLAVAWLQDQWFSGLWIGALGWFAFRNASTYNRITNLQEALLQLAASDAMTREFRVVDANQTLRQFADEYILASTGADCPYYAASDGRYRGQVFVEDLQVVERSQWDIQTVESIARSLNDILSVQEKTPLVEVINYLETQQLQRVTVLSPAGTVAGVIDRGDVVRALASKINLNIADTEIKRIKAEGTYPPSLQLDAIAKATTV